MSYFYDIIITPLLTEKGTRLSANNQYLFQVKPGVNKLQIKEAVEKIYKVKVKSVRTMNFKGKKKRIRYQQGYKADWKKAVVTLEKGQKIEIS